MIKTTLFFCLYLSTIFSASIEDTMTIEEKVGQILMVHFHGEIANEEAKVLIQDLHVGGFIYYNWANSLSSKMQVSLLSSSLQEMAKNTRVKIPLFISIDQEGGTVNRLSEGFTHFPANAAVAKTLDASLCKKFAKAVGLELSSVGININFAPVVDINNNKKSILGVRSFGKSPETVCTFAKAYLEGCKDAHILSTLKHFPGLGDVAVDPHYDLPILNKTKKELKKRELIPFSALSREADLIMTAHIYIPSIDPKNVATLSKDIIDILRKDIGCKKVLITDSLIMEGLLKNVSSIEEAAILAFNAGNDILLLGGARLNGTQVEKEITITDVKRVHKALVDAVRKGIIKESRLNASIKRILHLKKAIVLDTSAQFSYEEHARLAQEIASLAVFSTKNILPTSLPLFENRTIVIVPKLFEKTLSRTSLSSIGKETTLFFYNNLEISKEELGEIISLVKNKDLAIVCTCNAFCHLSQKELISILEPLPTIVLALNEPRDSYLFENQMVIVTYGPSPFSIDAAVKLLESFSLEKDF